MSQYSRVFITLLQDRSGYGLKSRDPLGRAIIEVKDGMGKITIAVQELKREIVYKAYIVSSSNDGLAVSVGNLRPDDRGKAELKWEFDPIDVEQTGIAIHAFDVVTLVVESKAENAWVLTGYRDGEVRFKDKFKVAVKRERASIQTQDEKESKPLHHERESKPLHHERESKPLHHERENKPLHHERESKPSQHEKESKPSFLKPMRMFVDEGPASHPEMKVVVESVEINPEKEPDAEAAEYIGTDKAEYEPKEPSADTHTKFNSMAQRFNKELEELENLMLEGASPEVDTQLELENIIKNNTVMSPFKTGFEEVKWVRISIKELTYLPCNYWKLIYDPYVNLAFSRYKHMMLGAYSGCSRYILALPDAFDPSRERQAKNLGFDIFRSSDNIIGQRDADYGYWLMEIGD